jgi:hypothetical protein
MFRSSAETPHIALDFLGQNCSPHFHQLSPTRPAIVLFISKKKKKNHLVLHKNKFFLFLLNLISFDFVAGKRFISLQRYSLFFIAYYF